VDVLLDRELVLELFDPGGQGGDIGHVALLPNS
jgi:hypothetical protein